MRSELLRLIDADTGALERRIPLGARPVFAQIEVHAGQLRYRPFGKIVWIEAENEPPRLLERFLALAEATDNEIEAYARECGILGLCRHGLSAGHESLRTRLAWIAAAEGQLRKPLRTLFDRLMIERLRAAPAAMDAPCFSPAPGKWTRDTVLSEPLVLWRAYSFVTSELLTANFECQGLADTLDHWLSLTPLRPSCMLDRHGRLTLRFHPVQPLSALFAMLGLQVFFTRSGSGSVLVCSGCGQPYIPKRLPRTGNHTYCPKCGIKAAWCQASRGYYERKTGKEKSDGTQA